LLTNYGKTGIEFKKGYPVFEPFAYRGYGGVKAVVKVDGLQGNRGSDFRKARDAYQEELKKAGDPNWAEWPKPNENSQGYAPKGYNWHHHQNRKTMILVPEEIHLVSKGGVPHCGEVFCEK